jgi:hypothetical protein
VSSQSVFWIAAVAWITIYCAAQAVRDFRAKRYGWAIAAALSTALLISMPFPTHSITINLPRE